MAFLGWFVHYVLIFVVLVVVAGVYSEFCAVD